MSIIRYICFVFILISSPTLAATQVTTALDDFDKASQFVSKQDGVSALKLFEQGFKKLEQGETISEEKRIAASMQQATAFFLVGKIPAVEKTTLPLLPAIKRIYGENSIEYITANQLLALSYQLSGQYKKSIDTYDIIIALQKDISSVSNENRAQIYSLKSQAHQQAGEFYEAINAERKQLAILLNGKPVKNNLVVLSYARLGYLAEQLGDYESSLAFYKQQYDLSLKLENNDGYQSQQLKLSIERLEKENKERLAGNDLNTLNSFSLNVYEVDGLGFPDDMLKILNERIDDYGIKHPVTLMAITQYADSLALGAQNEKAIQVYKRAIILNKILFESDNADLAGLYLRKSAAHNFMSNTDWSAHYPMAVENAKKAVDLYATIYGDSHLRSIIALNHYWQLHRFNSKKSSDNFDLVLRMWRAYTTLEKNMLPYMSKKQRIGLRQAFSQLQDNMLETAWTIDRSSPPYTNDLGEPVFGPYFPPSTPIDPKVNKTLDEMKAEMDTENKLMDTALKKNEAIREQHEKQVQQKLQLLYDEWVNYKGGVSAFENSLNRARLISSNKKTVMNIDKLLALRREQAELVTTNTSNSYNYLNKNKEAISNLQSVLEKSIPDLRINKKLSSRELAASLSSEQVFIDFARYINSEYIAFVIEPNGKIHMRRLIGPASSLEGSDDINISIRKVRGIIDDIIDGEVTIKRSNTLMTKELESLYESIILPMNSILSKYDTIVSSPDGLLSLLPMSLLKNNKSNQYLIEQFNIRSVPSAREWLRLKSSLNSKLVSSKSAIFANPDFNVGSKAIPTQCVSQHPNRSARDVLMKTFKDDCISALPATAAEANAINALMPASNNFQNAMANETTLLEQKSPNILHLATHGFFIPDASIVNPLDKSGIILSGANTSLALGKSEGIVTGKRIATMDLSGTNLVVLSACETGVGDIQAGEGVAGLNQAFIRAGAKGVVMSLWRVPDKATANLMSALYKAISKGAKPAAALRDAQLKAIKQNSHPLSWAAFVYNG